MRATGHGRWRCLPAKDHANPQVTGTVADQCRGEQHSFVASCTETSRRKSITRGCGTSKSFHGWPTLPARWWGDYRGTGGSPGGRREPKTSPTTFDFLRPGFAGLNAVTMTLIPPQDAAP